MKFTAVILLSCFVSYGYMWDHLGCEGDFDCYWPQQCLCLRVWIPPCKCRGGHQGWKSAPNMKSREEWENNKTKKVDLTSFQTDISNSTVTENATTKSTGEHILDVLNIIWLIFFYPLTTIIIVFIVWYGVYTLPLVLQEEDIIVFLIIPFSSLAVIIALFVQLLHLLLPNHVSEPITGVTLSHFIHEIYQTLIVRVIDKAYNLLKDLILPPIRNSAIFFCLVSLSPFVLALPLTMIATLAWPFFIRFHLPLPFLDPGCGVYSYPHSINVFKMANWELVAVLVVVYCVCGLHWFIRVRFGYDNDHNRMPRFRVLMIVVAQVLMAVFSVILAQVGFESVNQVQTEVSELADTQIVLWSTRNETDWFNYMYVKNHCKSDIRANESLAYTLAIFWGLAAFCALVSMAVWRPKVVIQAQQVLLNGDTVEANEE